MPVTDCDLYRALMGDARRFKPVAGKYPGLGVLEPRWFDGEPRYRAKFDDWYVDTADVDYAVDREGAPVMVDGEQAVETGGGTSLHDIPGFFKDVRDFWLPEGTEYSDQLYIRRGKNPKTSAAGTRAFHYQIEVRTRMAPTTFKGYLDNMARAAVARQVELART